MSDKGNVYYCEWKKNADGFYEGWLTKNPSLRVEEYSIDEMITELGEIVGEHFNDHEAALQFEPDLNSESGYEHLFIDGLVSLVWNTGTAYTASKNTAFKSGRCEQCGRGLGPRSAEQLALDYIGSGTDGAFSYSSNQPPPCDSPGGMIFVSQQFLDQLTPQELLCLPHRPVQMPKRSRRQFFELVPKKFVEPVAIPGLKLAGWQCDLCGTKCFSHGKTLGWGTDVVCQSDLPKSLPPFFFVGDRTQYHLCTSDMIFRRLKGGIGSKKLGSFRLGVIAKKDCNRSPSLPTLTKLADFRKKHGFQIPYHD